MSRITRCFWLSLILTVLLGPVAPAAAQYPAFQSNALRRADCAAFDLDPKFIAEVFTVTVECSYLTVPADYASPDGATIELAVAVFKSTMPDRRPDPLFFAQGGPGASTIHTYTQLLFTSDGRDLLTAGRDLVLFDQRGTLYSKPNLYCTEVDELYRDTLDEDLPQDEWNRRYRVSLTACYERLAQETTGLQIDGAPGLSAFDSLENARDIETLRQALGYAQINLYGVSYGSLLALHYLRLFPASLRSVIIDGVVPTQTDFVLDVSRHMDRSFTRVFESCAADRDCNRAYPDLETVFGRVIERLNAEPARVRLTDYETFENFDNALIDGDAFLTGLFQMLYNADLVLMLPRMIYDADRGDLDVFARIYSLLLFDRSMSYGMYYSVLCAEDADIDPADADLSGVRPQIVAVEQDGPAEFLAECDIWKVSRLDEAVDAPVTADVPTLLLSGGFDPITPAEYAEQAAATLSRAYPVVVPTGAHGQALEGSCQNAIILDFLADPATAPDTACLADLTLEFYTPRTVVDLPALIQLLNLAPLPTAFGLILLAALALLWSAALILPLAWIVNQLRRPRTPAPAPAWGSSVPPGSYTTGGFPTSAAPSAYPAEPAVTGAYPPASTPTSSMAMRNLPHPPRGIARFTSLIALAAALLLTVFLGVLVYRVFDLVKLNDNLLLYGLPGSDRPLFLLPPLFSLLGLALIFAAFQSWAQRLGSLPRRLYYTLLALAAVAAIAALAFLGMLTALF